MNATTALKFALAFSDQASALSFANQHPGILLSSNRPDTAHLPFAALFLCVTDDLSEILTHADIGAYLVCERTLKNQPLAHLDANTCPGAIGVFTMIANPSLGAEAADRHWRDVHAPLALRVHTAMTHYYQLSIVHRFRGPDWHGFALCCFKNEADLRERFYNSEEGARQIARDVAVFANTTESPRRVITKMSLS